MLAMFERWVGAEKFRAGVRSYLAAHAYGNATERDFLEAIEAASRPGVAAAFSTFLDQPGVPVVDVELSCAAERRTPVAHPAAPAAGRLEGLEPRDLEGAGVLRAGDAGGGGARLRAPRQAGGELPRRRGQLRRWVLANDGELGYYRASYEGDLLAKLLAAPTRSSRSPSASA